MNVDVFINIQSFPIELEKAILEIEKTCVFGNVGVARKETQLPQPNTVWHVDFQKNTNADHCHTLTVEFDSSENWATVCYSRPVEAFRGLGRLLAGTRIKDAKEASAFVRCSERAQFQSLGAMIDCSRCAVLSVECLQYIIRTCALAGLNTLQLYTEDTYPVPGEPFFGYFRGRFSFDELRAVDDYAFQFGIEVFPCIQTLGHMGQVLQWPRFTGIRDTHEVFLCGSEETYLMLYKMIESASAPFRSKRIHIGMDEAHGLSEGRYKQLFGARDSTMVFLDHLKAVHDICAQLGKRPMIWSDMLFCLAANDTSLSSYYDMENPGIHAKAFLSNLRRSETKRKLPPPSPTSSMSSFKSFSSGAPAGGASNRRTRTRAAANGRRNSVFSDASSMETDEKLAGADSVGETDHAETEDEIDLDLVYWDYYHTDSSVYTNKIRQHRQLGIEPWVAGGIWTWNRLFAALPFTFEATSGCLEACKSAGVQNVFATIWGDDGNECDILSAIPGIIYFGEHGYTPCGVGVDEVSMSHRFAGVCGGGWRDFVLASSIDMIPHSTIPVDTKTHFPPNIAKWLLWQDTASSIFSPQLQGYDFPGYFEQTSRELCKVLNVPELPFNERLRFPALVAAVLAVKCRLRDSVISFYESSDYLGVCNAVLHPQTGQLFQLRVLVEELWRYHRDEIWLKNNKPFGLEIIELRYGGLRTRLQTLMDRLVAWLYSHRPSSESAIAALQDATSEMPFVSPQCSPTDPNARTDFDGYYSGHSILFTSASRQTVLQSLIWCMSRENARPPGQVANLPELEAEALVIWEHVGPALVLDFSRAYTPARALGTG